MTLPLRASSKVAAYALKTGDRIWLNPGHAGTARTVDVAKPHYGNDEDIGIVFYAEAGLPSAYLRVPRTYNFDRADA